MLGSKLFKKLTWIFFFLVFAAGTLLFQNFRHVQPQLGLNEANYARRGPLTKNLFDTKLSPAMATTPDGRVIVNRILKSTTIDLTFQPLKHFERYELWEGSQDADSLISDVPPFKLSVPLSKVMLESDDEDIVANSFNGTPLPENHKLRPDGFGLRQGTVFFDTRFSETAIPVSSVERCTFEPDHGVNLSVRTDKPGDFLCYKLIVMLPIRLSPFNDITNTFSNFTCAEYPNACQDDETTTDESGSAFQVHRAFQARVSVAVQVKSMGLPLKNPIIPENGVKLNSNFTQSLTQFRDEYGKLQKMGFTGLEISSVSDGRLILWNEAGQLKNRQFDYIMTDPYHRALAITAFNPTPHNSRKWMRPVYFNKMHKRYGPGRTDGSLKICPSAVPCDLATEGVAFESVYAIAGSELRAGDGTLLKDDYRCAYGWITPDGGNAICGINPVTSGIIGAGTKFILRDVDSPSNGFTELVKTQPAAENPIEILGKYFCTSKTVDDPTCYRPFYMPPNYIFPIGRLDNRPQMPLGLGTHSGFWRSMPDSRPKNWLLSQRQPSLQLFLRNDMLNIFRPPKVRVENVEFDDTVKLVESKEDLATFEYAEVQTSFVEDGNFLFFLQMDKATSSSGGLYKDMLGDASGNFIVGKANEDAVSEAVFNADHPQKKYFSSDGFVGRGWVFRKDTAFVTVEPRNKQNSPNPLKDLREQFSVELAVKPLRDLHASRVRLVKWNQAFELHLDKGFVEIKLYNATNLSASTNIFSSNASLGDKLVKDRYVHIGVAFKGGVTSEREMILSIDGRIAKVWKEGLPSAVSSDGVFTLGGSCSGNCSGPIMMLDEVGLSKVSRKIKYFRTAALRTAVDATASDELYPHANDIPLGFHYTDAQMPEAMRPYLGGGANKLERYRKIVTLGRTLFSSRLLSAHKNKLGTTTTHNVSCATCHRLDKAFTDGFRLAPAINNLTSTLNTPTLINRVFSNEQFFDQRTADTFEQSIHPVTNPVEMGGEWSLILEALKKNSNINDKFTDAFPLAAVKPTKEQVQVALTAFVSTIRTGVDLQAKINSDEKFARGYQVFIGRGRCVACHSGPNFTDELRHDTFGIGKKFKTPTLLNISQTGPYMHDGSIATLKEVIKFYMRPKAPEGGHLDSELRPLTLSQNESLEKGDIPDLEYFLMNLNGEVQFGN